MHYQRISDKRMAYGLLEIENFVVAERLNRRDTILEVLRLEWVYGESGPDILRYGVSHEFKESRHIRTANIEFEQLPLPRVHMLRSAPCGVSEGATFRFGSVVNRRADAQMQENPLDILK